MSDNSARAEVSCLRLNEISVSKRAIHAHYALGDLRFNSAIWYDSVDFRDLYKFYGTEVVDRMAFHVAAFEMNKLVSLRPDRVDWGDYVRFATSSFRQLWLTVYRNVWAQWRFENADWNYLGPDMAISDSTVLSAIKTRRPEAATTLCFCGGGKDSLVAMKLLEQLDVPYDALTYATSFYGTMAPQHALIDGLIATVFPKARRKQWITDDFLDVPVISLLPELDVKSVTAAETPSSIFGSLPYALQHGYDRICLAHERSANSPQAFSPKGEPINHQWGKSYEAEKLINDYIEDHLIQGFRYYSVLKPIYDTNIFGLLRNYPQSVPLTHSCNIRKPWCMACAKCLYVWLGYAAFLDKSVVQETFGLQNPLENPANSFIYRQLVGLERQLPFECIGEAGEAALNMLLCRARGISGTVTEDCLQVLDELNLQETLQKYLDVDIANSNVPIDVERLDNILRKGAFNTRTFVEKTLA